MSGMIFNDKLKKNIIMPRTMPTKKTASKKTAAKKAPAKKSAAPKKSASSTARKQAASMTDESMLLDFFKDELKDIYWAEKHLVKSLPKMQKAASSEALANAFAEHLEVTKVHVERLEEVFALVGETPKAKKCDAMDGLVEEGKGIIEDTDAGTATRDVGLILAAQKIEHYEIATYGGLTQLAKTLGLDEAKEILGQTLSEEKEADMTLTDIAENDINVQAASEEEE
jgi:ferritin-like metal-binding protein YciE